MPEWTKALPWRGDYLTYSAKYADTCLSAAKWGRRWTNPSCESLFGPADQPGEFVSGGAPRWKQRALYDAMKDDMAVHGGEMRLVRLATVDVIADATLGDVLERRSAVDLDRFRQFVEERST